MLLKVMPIPLIMIWSIEVLDGYPKAPLVLKT